MFTPLTAPGSALSEKLTGRIHHIAEEVKKETLTNERVDAYGGRSGIALSFAWLGSMFPDKDYSDHAFELMNTLIDTLAEIEWAPEMGCELSSAGFVMQYLQNNGIIDNEDDLGLEAVDEFLLTAIPVLAEQKNWDPILGLVPVGNYFLERYKKTGDTAPLELIAEHLIKLSSIVEGYHVWITPGHRYQPKDCLNFGMAHGMPGLIAFLSKLYAAGIKKNELEPLVNSCIQYLLSKQNTEDAGGQFPSYIFPGEEEEQSLGSRLGWCYGDLGMSFALLHWGHVTHQQELIKKATDIAIKTTARTLETAACTDGPFCHGASGLAHQYNRIYQYTKDPALKDAALKWTDITLDHFFKPEMGAGGYPFMFYDETDKTIKAKSSISLLEGAMGVALVFVSLLSEEVPSWDALFGIDLPEQM